MEISFEGGTAKRMAPINCEAHFFAREQKPEDPVRQLEWPEKLCRTTNEGLKQETHIFFTQAQGTSTEGNDKKELMAVKFARERVNRTIKLAKNLIFKMKADRKIQLKTPHYTKAHGETERKRGETTAAD
jgi:hemerythrin superfamily protein